MKLFRLVPVTVLAAAAVAAGAPAVLGQTTGQSGPVGTYTLAHARSADASYPLIHIIGTVNVRPTPDTSQLPLGTVNDADEPVRVCWTAGENIDGVDVWFRINYDGATGYITSYWDDSHYATDADVTTNYGIPSCADYDTGAATANPQQGANPQPTTSGSLPVDDTGGGYFNRDAVVEWATAHANDIQWSGAECSWFVSQALWAGGMEQTPDWNSSMFNAHGLAPWHWLQPGTQDATVAPLLFNYLQQIDPWATITPITFDASSNYLPQAEDGDVIAYNWDGTDPSGIDHLAVVTGHSPTNPNYPLVSEWGTTDYPGQRAGYSQRGYTWSAKNNTWLVDEQNVTDLHGWLIHFQWPDPN